MDKKEILKEFRGLEIFNKTKNPTALFGFGDIKVIRQFLIEALSKQESEWLKRKKEEKIATAEAGEQMCEMRLKKQKEEIEKEVEERISEIEQIRCDEMLKKIRQIVVEDVPHQYQGRLLEELE